MPWPHYLTIQGSKAMKGRKVQFYDVLWQTACISNPHGNWSLFQLVCFFLCLRVSFGDVGSSKTQSVAKLPFCRFRSSCLVKITGSGGNPYLTTAHPHSFHQVLDGRNTFWIGIGCASGRARIIVSSGLGRWKFLPSFWIIFAEPGPQLCTVQTAWAQYQYHKAFIPTTLGIKAVFRLPLQRQQTHCKNNSLLFFLPANFSLQIRMIMDSYQE